VGFPHKYTNSATLEPRQSLLVLLEDRNKRTGMILGKRFKFNGTRQNIPHPLPVRTKPKRDRLDRPIIPFRRVQSSI
jgi:hypothetical protein